MEEVEEQYSAKPLIYDSNEEINLFIFPIRGGLKREERDVYEATRAAWKVSVQDQKLRNSYAIGVATSIVQATYKINSWENDAAQTEKHIFRSEKAEVVDFNDMRIRKIISENGYWRYGNYLIVKFLGNNKYKFIRGNKDHNEVFSL